MNKTLQNFASIFTKTSGIFLFLILVFAASSVFAQKKSKVTAKGSYQARDLTMEEVKVRAVEDAKQNAMVKAGISVNVKVSDFLYTFEDDEKFKNIFQSFVSTETGADIIVEEVRELNRDINEFDNILIEVEIDAIIIKHKKEKDATFDFKVEGIREFYYENDPLDFCFQPTRNGYLKIFNVSEETAFILYPYNDTQNPHLNDDPEKLFHKNVEVSFPVNEMIGSYYFEIDTKNVDTEYNLLIFVFTKDDYAFLEDVNVDNIMSWIFEIPLDQKAVQQVGIVVKR